MAFLCAMGVILAGAAILVITVCHSIGYGEGRKNAEYSGSGEPVEWAYALGYVAGVRKFRRAGRKPTKLTRKQKTMNKLNKSNGEGLEF